ncbi:hypothetical protein CVM39_17905 [Pseudooceanicola antarcticus]|uniref:Uncharacterized protein n=2 Tax=Pseudooceanicola antarcticus TaxID=1247613 RepID=A0ABX4MJB8_9RHOB|nr:hypothetical protein CVM39_17905 [Pseudooceanicola antarcticus]
MATLHQILLEGSEMEFEGLAVQALPERLMKTPAFVQALAHRIVDLGMSGDETVDFVLGTIFDFVSKGGVLLDAKGEEIGIDDIIECFSEEPRRWINSTKKWASKPPKQRLQQRCVARVTFIYLAFQIVDKNFVSVPKSTGEKSQAA